MTPHRLLVPQLSRALLAASFLPLTWTGSALACGGFFCSASAPVNQAAERIIFAQDSETTTQIVEILYEGPSERFAWVLPVPGTPDIAVSSSQVFDRLQQATNPTYTLTDIFPENCDAGGLLFAPTAASGSGGASNRGESDGPAVTVLDAGSVGPFDYETISVDAADTDPAEVAVRWLEENGYDVGSLGSDVLRPYLENGLNLVAVRLQKGVSTGSIQPLSLTFEGSQPSIPIRPTAVAANDDMGVLVWILGESRAVPVNYLGLELNEMFINWINPASNYGDVVSRAADEAGGQGFVTELAGSAAPYHDVIDAGWVVATPDPSLTGLQFASQLADLAQRYGSWDGFVRMLSQHVAFRDDLGAEDFATCPYCYIYPGQYYGYGSVDVDYGQTFDEATDPILATDLETLFQAVDDDVLQPVRDAADLFKEHPYVTRLYTTMSAEEMTLDPVFDFNPDLEDVSNTHTAERQLTCEGGSGPWRVTLADGRKIYGEGFTWPLSPEEPDEVPLNARVVSFSTQGPARVEKDNADKIQSSFAALPPSKNNGIDGGAFGCALAVRQLRSQAPLALVAFAGLVAALRRPRRGRRAASSSHSLE